MTSCGRDRAGKLALLLLLASLLAAAPGCDLFFPSSGRDAGGVDAPDVSFPWVLGTVNRGPHRAGAWLTFPVERVTVDPSEVYLWVLEDDLAFPLRARRASLPPAAMHAVMEGDGGIEDAGAEDATRADAGPESSFVFMSPLPLARAGVFHLAIGTIDAPMTRGAEVEIVLEGATMTQAQAADALGAGLSGLVADVGDLLGTEDPEWQAIAADEGLAEVVAAYDAMQDDLDGLAALTRERYLALPADAEPGVQELLWNSGLLEALASRASGVSMLTFGGGPLESALVRSPFQGFLFSADALSLLLAAFGIVCDVVAIVGALVTLPVGGEGGLLGVGPKIVCAILRVIIDNVIPTDLTRIFEIQSSRVVYETEGSMVVPWGVFAPQNRTAGSAFRSLEDLVLAVVEAVVPGGGASARGLRPALREVGNYILTHLPGFIADFIFQRVDFPHIELALPIDMGFYNIQLSQVLRLFPPYIGVADAIGFLELDPEILSPYSGSFIGTGRVTSAYDTRSVGFTDVEWRTTAPTERRPVNLGVHAFAFASTGPEALNIQIVQIPLPYRVQAGPRFFQVQQAPDPADRNARISDEDFIVLDVNLVGGGTTRVVRPSTTPIRVHPLWIDDLAGGRPDQTVVDVLVNGTVQFASAVVPGDTVLQLPLTLQPGVNEVRVVATSGHTIGCGPSSTDPVCLEITFPEADNVNHRYVAYGAVGVSRDVRAWTPPTFPTEM